MPRKLTSVSLFAGAGGMTLGLQRVGFQTLLATDNEKSSQATFKRNFPQAQFLLKDIRHVTKKELSKLVDTRVDLLVGGPPCQGFSTLGDQNPADPRNGLLWVFLRVVEWLNPSCVLMENVNYLRTQYGGRYEREIVAAFERLGYQVCVTTLNAAEFGVPQIRKRVFFFATKLQAEFEWPTVTHGPGLKPYETVWAAIGDLANTRATAPNHVHLNHGEKVLARYALIPEGGRMPPPSELPAEIRRKNFGNTYKRLHRKRPSLTLVPGNNAFPVHPTLHRSLSAREGARLQTFPDSFEFFGTRAEQCRLVGNAVPVRLAEHLGRAIQKHINSKPEQTAKLIPLQSLRPDSAPAGLAPMPSFKLSGITGISFFTGIGGLALGFMNAGVELLASYDMKESVARNCEFNFPSLNHIKADVSGLTVEQVRKDIEQQRVDVIFGGPPCQGFSVFGRRRFVNTRDHKPECDERNDLSLKFVELAIGLSPRMIFMENVKGFLSTPKGESTYLGEVEQRLRDAGYKFQHRVINCAAYGIPQARERFILVAWKPRLAFVWPEGRHFFDPRPWQKPVLMVGDVISDLMDPATYGELFSHAPMKHKELVVERYKLIPEGGRLPEGALTAKLRKGYRSDNVKNYSHVYRRLSMSAPATTMVPGHNAFPVHPVLNRTLTVREAARIQTFPDWMRFQGTRQQQCTLVGNAVPPALAEVFATAIVKGLKGNFQNEGYKRDVYDLATAS
jgi:DNA (cytosine-5)-methyltransferase 1